MGPWGTKHDIWPPVLIKKCQQAQIACVYLFSCQKTYIIIFQNSQEILNFVPIYFESPGTHNLNKDHNFSWISPLQVKLRYHMFSRNTWNLSFLAFLITYFLFFIIRILVFLVQHYCQIWGLVSAEWNFSYSVSIFVNSELNWEVWNREVIAFNSSGKSF